jgi:negative regulator of replication initiation
MVDPLVIPIFGVIVGVPSIAWATTDIVRRVLKYKEIVHTSPNGQSAERAAHQATKIERLEQRMGVMERILTDRSTHLSDEIEKLRSLPAEL